jgi:hypothetical protein
MTIAAFRSTSISGTGGNLRGGIAAARLLRDQHSAVALAARHDAGVSAGVPPALAEMSFRTFTHSLCRATAAR